MSPQEIHKNSEELPRFVTFIEPGRREKKSKSQMRKVLLHHEKLFFAVWKTNSCSLTISIFKPLFSFMLIITQVRETWAAGAPRRVDQQLTMIRLKLEKVIPGMLCKSCCKKSLCLSHFL
jgi:hypothetical protein